MEKHPHKRLITIKHAGEEKAHEAASLQDTVALARSFVSTLRGGEIVALSGNLGSGKTTFVQSCAHALGVHETVTSPTFVLMKTYRGERLSLCHIDAYRLSSGAELAAIGAVDYLGSPDTVTFIEWPERVRDIVPTDAIHITFEILYAS